MALPELFGDYLLHHELARGTTSAVFLAQTTGEYPRLCAVKRIRRELAGLPDFAPRFRRDAELLVRLAHGNVVQILEVGSVEDLPFVAMEHIDGIDIGDLIVDVPRQGPLPPEFVLYVGLEMCEAVSYLQLRRREESGTHRFPADMPWALELMLSFDGVVKIVDLGAFGALRLGAQPIRRLFRSPGYAAPEVIRKQTLDIRSELFAVGLVLWEALSGQRLAAADPERYVRAVLDGTWEAPLIRRQDVAGDTIRLVAELLRLDPRRRPSDLESVRQRLVSALRRVAPSYGSGALARLLWNRCQPLIGRAEELTAEVAQRAQTIPTTKAAGRTNTYGKAGPSDRPYREPAVLRPGAVIPGTRYRVVRSLGRGGSADVYAAQHVDLDRQVAIKVLSPQLAQSSEAIAQFRTEARACSRISAPNIVDVIDFGELDDGRFFFAMELLDGKPLARVLAEETTIALPRALAIFRQVAKALQAAHDQGIVHRDLKPENIMLVERDGRGDFVKLLDFGVMAFTSDRTRMRAGTPGYMAPEQVAGDPPTPAMDIYATGCTLYEVLCGETPYPAESTESFIEHQARKPPPALRSHPRAAQIPPAIERVVHRALARDPAARQLSMAQFETELLHAQQEAGVVTPWDDLPQPDLARRAQASRPLSRRQRGRLVWIAGGLAGAIGALVVTLTIDDRAQAPPRSGAVLVPRATSTPTAEPRAEQSPPLRSEIAAIEAAVARGHFTHPRGQSALDQILALERQPSGDEAATRLRQDIARTLVGAADRLAAAKMTRPARTLYQEALLFTPDSTRLQTLAYPAERRRRGDARPRPDLAQIAWLVSEIQQAVAAGRFLEPRDRNAVKALLRQLEKLDPSGQLSAAARARMTRTLRQEAERLWRADQRDKARPLYEVIASLHPTDRTARRRAGANPAVAAALPPWPSPSAEDRARTEALLVEGNELLRRGKLGEARRRFLSALSASPQEAQAVTGLATVAFEQARYAQAVELAERAVRLDGARPQAHLVLGDAYFKLLRYDDARRAWQRVLSLEPGNQRASERMEMLKRRAN